jgi:hypothetical protein
MNILGIFIAIMNSKSLSFKRWAVPDTKLKKISTLKKDADKKNFKRPGNEFLIQDFAPWESYDFKEIPDAAAQPTDVNGDEVALAANAKEEPKIEEQIENLNIDDLD